MAEGSLTPQASSISSSYSRIEQSLNQQGGHPTNPLEKVGETNIGTIGTEQALAHEKHLQSLGDLVQGAILANPDIEPQDLAHIALTQKADVLDQLATAAKALANFTRRQDGDDDKNTMPNLDSGLIGIALAASGWNKPPIAPGFALVALVNAAEGKANRFCIGTRAGLAGPHVGTGGVGTSVVLGGFEYQFVPGAALFVGASIGSTTALISTKAQSATEVIGLVFVSGMPPSLPTMDELKGTNAQFAAGETWCFPMAPMTVGLRTKAKNRKARMI